METNTSGTTAQPFERFDQIIGMIEEIVISEEFQKIQHSFMDKYYLEFEDTEENKFIYTEIFQEYGAVIERYMDEQLCLRMPDFSMAKFSASLDAHKCEIADEIFDMFITFTDYVAFKELFLDYLAEKEGRNMNLLQGFVIHSIMPNPCS